MGLPLFVIPKEPEAIAKSPEKAAAAPRSAIRRRPMRLRDSINASHQQRRERYRQIEAEVADLDRQMSRADARIERLRSLHRQTQITAGAITWGDADRPFLEQGQRRSPEFRVAPRSERQSEGVPVFEERWRSERTERRPRAAPTPPYNDSESVPSEHSLTPLLPVPPTMTPALSPTPRSESASPSRPIVTVTASREHDSRAADVQRDIRNRVLETMAAERAEAMNRTADDWRWSRNHLRRARINRQTQLDGLGDRNRSVSPDGAWDTLLTSITPDPQPPSAGSSFASTTAAGASVSVAHSATTPDTSISNASTSHILNAEDCDLSDANTVEDDEEDIYELLELDSRGERRNLHWRTYATGTRSATPSQDQLRGMHQIIAGLVEREDIPNEWWASVGLSRNL